MQDDAYKRFLKGLTCSSFLFVFCFNSKVWTILLKILFNRRGWYIAGGERGAMCRAMHKIKRDSLVPCFRLLFVSTPTLTILFDHGHRAVTAIAPSMATAIATQPRSRLRISASLQENEVNGQSVSWWRW